MALIPTKRDLGPLESVRATPGFSPAQSYEGAAMANLGRTVQQVGGVISDVAAQKQRELDGTAEEAKRYGAMDAFDKWRDTQRQTVNEGILGAQPGAAGFVDGITKNVDKSAAEFLATVPAELRPQYQVAVNRARSDAIEAARGFEVKERTRFEGANLDETVDRKILGAASDPANADARKQQQAEAEAFIKNNPYLTQIEKDQRLRALPDKFAIGVGNAVNADPAANAAIFGAGAAGAAPAGTAAPTSDGGAGDHRSMAASILRKEEGFRTTPYWDVNAHRVGYGSDTTTRADGSVERVTTATRVSKDDAERDLFRRLGEFEKTAVRQVGAAWDGLPSLAKAGLLSVVYNYGSLPKSVAGIVKSGGGVDAIASAVSQLTANKGRRKAEAEIIRGGGDIPTNGPTMAQAQAYWADAYPGASVETIQSLASRSLAARNRFDQEQVTLLRADIGTAVENAPVALQNTGEYAAPMPTQEQFQQAYGPREGGERYQQFQTSVEVAQTAYQMQTMPASEIQNVVNQAAPVSAGNDAALEQKRYETLSKAAASIMQSRSADPSSYVRNAFPVVQQAWAAVGSDFGGTAYRDALRVTADAQTRLGIPLQEQLLLPKEAASSVVASFKDVNAAEPDRVNAVINSIFSTPDRGQQQAIFQQLVKSGLPDITEGALEAAARGDTAAAQRLMRAALVDPTKLPGKTDVKDGEIDQAIQDEIMADGELGDAIYGLSSGTSQNYERASRDSDLITRSIKLRVREGQDLDEAVAGVKKDLYGDMKVFTGGYGTVAMLAVPESTDTRALGEGLDRSLPMFRSQLERQAEGVLKASKAPTADGGRAILAETTKNEINRILDSGEFRSVDNGVGLFDAMTGTFVAGPDGKPFVLPLSDILSAQPEKPAAEASPLVVVP